MLCTGCADMRSLLNWGRENFEQIMENRQNITNNMDMKYCQSCGMPLTNEILGTNADGTTNEDYCIYCYKDGKFVQDMTMEQMIEHCAQFTDEINKNSGQNLTVEQMKEQMRQFFPHLKRWKN